MLLSAKLYMKNGQMTEVYEGMKRIQTAQTPKENIRNPHTLGV